MDSQFTLQQLQDDIRRRDCSANYKSNYLQKLMEEVGELARAMRKEVRYKDTGDMKGTLEEELYDVLYYVVAIANLYGIDLEHTVRIKEVANAQKYGQQEFLALLMESR